MCVCVCGQAYLLVHENLAVANLRDDADDVDARWVLQHHTTVLAQLLPFKGPKKPLFSSSFLPFFFDA